MYIWVFPNIRGNYPEIMNFNRVFHYFHHPFWGPTPIFGNTHIPIGFGSMYGIFTYIYHKIQPNVGKYTIHGSYGIYLKYYYVKCSPFFQGIQCCKLPLACHNQRPSTTPQTSHRVPSPRIRIRKGHKGGDVNLGSRWTSRGAKHPSWQSKGTGYPPKATHVSNPQEIAGRLLRE